MEDQLSEIQEWAQERLRTGAEPPWNHYRLMQLVDAIEHLDAGPISASTMDHLLQSESRSETECPRADDVVQLDSVRRHRDAEPQPPQT